MDIELVSSDSARRWLRGEFFVGDKITDAPEIALKDEVVFVNHIGDNLARAVDKIITMAERGSSPWIVAHVANPAIKKSLQARGMIVMFTEVITWKGQQMDAWRMYGNENAFANWLRNQNAAFLIGLT